MTNTLIISSDLKDLAQVEKFVEDICVYYNLSRDTYGNILVALSEAVSNAILHGNEANAEKQVEITSFIDKSETQLTFQIKDEGNGFDHKALPDPISPQNISRENGRGVFLMNILADEIAYSNNGSTVALKFKI